MPYRDPQALSHFEEMDRQSKAHHAAMNRKLGGGTFFAPQANLRGPRRVARIGEVVLAVLAWLIFAALMVAAVAFHWISTAHRKEHP